VLQDYIAKMILERRAELNGESTTRHIGLGRKDVFSLLVRASEEDSKLKLTDNELVSNNVNQSE
jgi:cytochrome P450